MFGKSKRAGLCLGMLLAAQSSVLAQLSGNTALRCVPISNCVSPLGGPRIGTSIIPNSERLILHLRAGEAGRHVTMQVRTDADGQIDLNNLNYRWFSAGAGGNTQPSGKASKVITYDCEQQDVRGEQATYVCTALR